MLTALFVFGLITHVIFLVVISKRVKDLRDMGREFRMEIKELNASVKYLKRKYNESIDASDT